MPNLIWSGLPTVITYHAADWAGFLSETVLDAVIDDEDGPVPQKLQLFKLGLRSL